jgi:hypothetical protein
VAYDTLADTSSAMSETSKRAIKHYGKRSQSRRIPCRTGASPHFRGDRLRGATSQKGLAQWLKAQSRS